MERLVAKGHEAVGVVRPNVVLGGVDADDEGPYRQVHIAVGQGDEPTPQSCATSSPVPAARFPTSTRPPRKAALP